MTAQIIRCDSSDAYDLIFADHLAMLSTIEQETMHRSMKNSSRIWVGEDDGKIIAVWGLIPPTLMSEVAYLWLFTTKHLAGHVFIFVRHSQRAVEEMLTEYPTIVGHTAIDNRKAQQWLRWLGAEFGEPVHNTVLPFIIKARQHSWPKDLGQSVSAPL